MKMSLNDDERKQHQLGIRLYWLNDENRFAVFSFFFLDLHNIFIVFNRMNVHEEPMHTKTIKKTKQTQYLCMNIANVKYKLH